MKRCTTSEDQIARLSDQLASRDIQVRPSSRQNPSSNRQATLPARKGRAQARALPTNEVDAAPPSGRGRLLLPVFRLQNRHHRLLGVRWYFGEFPPQSTLVRERLKSRGYMVDRLRELMLLGQLSPVQKIELSMVLDTISRIIMNMKL